MQKQSITQRIFLILCIFLLSSCGGNGSPEVHVNEETYGTTSYDESIHINNCGGKANSEQMRSRSISTNIEGGIDLGIQQVVEGVISAKYSQYQTTFVSHTLVAPAGTNMEFVLRWYEDARTGNVSVNGETGTYQVKIPFAVDQVLGKDLGCSGEGTAQPPTVNQPNNTLPNHLSTNQLCFGNCWQYNDDSRTMTWTGSTYGSEDIWQPAGESLQKIRSGYTAVITTSTPGEIFACILTINGQPVMSTCGLYQISAGTYQITSNNNSVGGFRWCPALGYGWRYNGGECK